MFKTAVNKLRYSNWCQTLGCHSQVYIVGGSVRDAIMHPDIKPKDVDLLVVGLSIPQIIEVLKPFGRIDAVGASFQVIKFVPTGETEVVDIAVPRKDFKIGDGHKGFELVTENVTFEEDMYRRDFTMNSIAYSLATDEFIDLFGGIDDIKSRTLRAVNVNAFTEDPLRILRGIGFASRFKLRIDDQTSTLMKMNAASLHQISSERVITEIEKIIAFNKFKADMSNYVNVLQQHSCLEPLFGGCPVTHNVGHLFCEIRNVSDFLYGMLLTMPDLNSTKFLKTMKISTEVRKGVVDLISLNELSNSRNEAELRYALFTFQLKPWNTPLTAFLPLNMLHIVELMRCDRIPTSLFSAFSGDDLLAMGIKEGVEVGRALKNVYKSALMEEFDWKSATKDDFFKYIAYE